MSTITPTTNGPTPNLDANATGIQPANSVVRQANDQKGVDSNWFGDIPADAPLIDAAPSPHLRNLSPQELSDGLMQHIMA